jgi:hypothetical protein
MKKVGKVRSWKLGGRRSSGSVSRISSKAFTKYYSGSGAGSGAGGGQKGKKSAKKGGTIAPAGKKSIPKKGK